MAQGESAQAPAEVDALFIHLLRRSLTFFFQWCSCMCLSRNTDIFKLLFPARILCGNCYILSLRAKWKIFTELLLQTKSSSHVRLYKGGSVTTDVSHHHRAAELCSGHQSDLIPGDKSIWKMFHPRVWRWLLCWDQLGAFTGLLLLSL